MGTKFSRVSLSSFYPGGLLTAVLRFKTTTKTLGFARLFKRYSKDRPRLLKERRATGLLIGVWVCSALQEFKLSTVKEGNVFVQKPWIMVLLLKWPAR